MSVLSNLLLKAKARCDQRDAASRDALKKLAYSVARGDDVTPEEILKTLDRLHGDVTEFHAAVELAARRLDLAARAGQHGVHIRTEAAAESKIRSLAAEFDAKEAALASDRWAAISPLEADLDAARLAASDALAARSELIRTAGEDAVAARDEAQRRLADATRQLAKLEEAQRHAQTVLLPAAIEKAKEPPVSPLWGDATFGNPHSAAIDEKLRKEGWDAARKALETLRARMADTEKLIASARVDLAEAQGAVTAAEAAMLAA